MTPEVAGRARAGGAATFVIPCGRERESGAVEPPVSGGGGGDDGQGGVGRGGAGEGGAAGLGAPRLCSRRSQGVGAGLLRGRRPCPAAPPPSPMRAGRTQAWRPLPGDGGRGARPERRGPRAPHPRGAPARPDCGALRKEVWAAAIALGGACRLRPHLGGVRA